MNVSFACPKCERPIRVQLGRSADEVSCRACGSAIALSPAAANDGHVERCMVCRSRDIYVRKDFPQWLGVWIVVLGFGASCVTWAYSRPIWTFAILFATAFIDVILYALMPTALVCYHCGAQYRDAANAGGFDGFDLDTHERHRQQRIRMAEHQRAGRQPSHAPDSSPEQPARASIIGE